MVVWVRNKCETNPDIQFVSFWFIGLPFEQVENAIVFAPQKIQNTKYKMRAKNDTKFSIDILFSKQKKADTKSTPC